jgi:transposase
MRWSRVGGRGCWSLRRWPDALLADRGETVLEVGRQARVERRLGGKDDPLDAIRAARAGLAAEAMALPRAGQRQEALRVLLLARRSAVDVRRVALVRLRSVIVTAPEQLREELRRLPLVQLLRHCSRFRRSYSRTPDELAVVLALRSLARRIEAATAEADELEREIRQHVRALAPELLDEPGVSPIVAAATDRHLVTQRSRPLRGRLCPTRRRRTTTHLQRPNDPPPTLSRGGDRQLNRALHTVVLHRRQHDPATRDYIARRVAEGKTTREATRILKRYLARHLYRVMQNATPLTT